jgi:hypothetical protein
MMKLIAPALAALFLSLVVPAAATGTVRIQQNDDSVQTYTGVYMRIVNNTLALTSADKVSTVVISGGACKRSGDLITCKGGGLSLHEDGTHTIPFRSATFYFNLTDQDAPLPLSSAKVGPHSVMFAAHTAKGTFITGTGRLDREPAK